LSFVNDIKGAFYMAIRRIVVLWTLILAVLGLSSVGAQEASDESPVKVVATYSILGDIVENIAGENIELTVLVGRDGDSHVYEPTPQDAIALAQADLIFENGLEFETWLDALYEASGSTAVRVVVSDGITPIEFGGHDHAHDDHDHAHDDHDHGHDDHDHAHDDHDHAHDDHDHAHDDHDHDHDHAHDDHAHDGHDHGEFDPHIWHDPNNGIVMAGHVRDALVAIDPAHAEVYQANAEAYIAELTAVDAYITKQVATIPAENRVLVTSHESFGYFAHRYGFEVVTALGTLSTDVADPSAGQMATLIEEIKAFGVPAIFGENITSVGLLEQLSRETGVDFVGNLYTDALGQVGTDGDSYLGLLRYNGNIITEALK
jgi:zinc/manganese transport system substrate-binding protein